MLDFTKNNTQDSSAAHKKNTAYSLACGAIIAALYVLLTFVSSIFGMSSGVIQVRISESLCVLPCFMGCAVPGLSVGCFISNLLFGGGIIDAVVGTAATLIGAAGTYLLRRHRILSLAPPILANALIIPLVQAIAFSVTEGYFYLALMIFIGEFISVGVLGFALGGVLIKYPFIYNQSRAGK